MKKLHYHLASIAIAAGLSLILPTVANAQSGPSGTTTNTVSDPANAVWDFAGIVTNVNVDVTGSIGSVDLSFPVTIQQSGSGKLSGSGDVTVALDYAGSDQSFPGTYKVSGGLTSSRDGAHLTFVATVAGMTSLPPDPKSRRVSATHQDNATINASTRTISGKRKLSASASGMGSIVENSFFGPLPLHLVGPFGNGSWTLTLTVSTTGKIVTGSAVVALNSGQTFHYGVKGSFNAKSNSSKLVLTGADLATKGSTLQVTMSGDAVTAIKGKITGQSVKVTF